MDPNDDTYHDLDDNGEIYKVIEAFRKAENVTLMSDFAQVTGTMDEDQFVASYDHPFLVLLTPLKDGIDHSKFITHDTDATSLRNLLDSPVFFVKKLSERNVFQGMITIGRSNNNDIAIPWSKLSKFHAYFSKQGDQWFVTDHDSSNGTYINRQRIDPQKAYVLEEGSVDLAFSKSLAFFFMTPRGMHRYMSYMKRIAEP